MDRSQSLSLILNSRHPLYQGSANYIPWTKSSQLIVFANKVLLEHSHVHLLPVAALAPQQSRWVVATETRWPTKPKMFTLWPFTEKVCWQLCIIHKPISTFLGLSCNYTNYKSLGRRDQTSNRSVLSSWPRVRYNTFFLTLHWQVL